MHQNPGGFLSDQFESPGVDVALARALVGQAHENLSKAIERAVFIDRDTLANLVREGETALEGQSNDAEHDALHEIVTVLREAIGPDES